MPLPNVRPLFSPKVSLPWTQGVFMVTLWAWWMSSKEWCLCKLHDLSSIHLLPVLPTSPLSHPLATIWNCISTQTKQSRRARAQRCSYSWGQNRQRGRLFSGCSVGWTEPQGATCPLGVTTRLGVTLDISWTQGSCQSSPWRAQSPGRLQDPSTTESQDRTFPDTLIKTLLFPTGNLASTEKLFVLKLRAVN